jgi:hypothetical protein
MGTNPRKSILLGTLALGGLFLVAGCMKEPKAPPTLSSKGEAVAFAYDTPSGKVARLVGTIKVVNDGREADEAEQFGRNELRNKAAELGASLVTVDQTYGNRRPFQDGVTVTVVGRAFKAVD